MQGTPVIYFKSLNRSFTVFGVDRSLFYLFVGICLAMAFSARLSFDGCCCGRGICGIAWYRCISHASGFPNFSDLSSTYSLSQLLCSATYCACESVFRKTQCAVLSGQAGVGMKFKSLINTEPAFSDLLNYAHLVDDGVILNKDGAFLVSYQFKGMDSHSASGNELDAVTASFNRMALGLEDGWMIHVDEVRVPARQYAALGAFPDPVSALIDIDRRQYYEASKAHYENIQFLTFVWKFPLPIVKATQALFCGGISKSKSRSKFIDITP